MGLNLIMSVMCYGSATVQCLFFVVIINISMGSHRGEEVDFFFISLKKK